MQKQIVYEVKITACRQQTSARSRNHVNFILIQRSVGIWRCSCLLVVVFLREGVEGYVVWPLSVVLSASRLPLSLSQHHLPLQGETVCVLQRCADISFHNIPSYSTCLILLLWTQRRQHWATRIFCSALVKRVAVARSGCMIKFSKQNERG